MKRAWLGALAACALLASTGIASAQAPALPPLTAEQAEQVNQAIAAERPPVEARVGRGELTPDEAERYLAWREWQIAQQVTGQAPPPVASVQAQPESVPRRSYGYAYAYPAPYYYEPRPYYWGPRYYWGPSVCAGGWGRHGGGSLCF